MTLRSAFLGIVLICGTSCAQYKNATSNQRRLIFGGHGAEAARDLEADAHKPGKDQLLYLLDLATALHTSGQYEKAIQEFLLAEKIAEFKDFTSITEETGTLLVTDNVKNYKGEDFEKILINVYLAIDYMMLGKLEDALVENRKVNQTLYRLIHEGARPYKMNPLAYYLGGFMYEKNRDINDAYIDYRSAHGVASDLPLVGEDLKSLSKILNFLDDVGKWNAQFPGNSSKGPANPTGRLDLKNKSYGDVLILVEVGRAPEKFPHPQWESLPKFRNSPYRYSGVKVLIDGKPVADTEIMFDVQKAAHETLDHRIGAMTAKKIGGVVAKAAVGAGIGAATKSEDLGILVAALLMAADQADLRSWLTLPANFQVARISVPAGKHSLELRYKQGGMVTSSGKTLDNFEVKAGSHSILHHRVIE